MLSSAIRQQPDLFENVAKHWQAVTGSSLFLLSPSGELLNSLNGTAAPVDWQPALADTASHTATALSVSDYTLLTAPLLQDDTLLGYLLAADAGPEQLELLNWVTESLLARLVDFQAMQSMTDELIGAWDQLELIFRVTENLALTADLKTVLRSILREIQKVAHTEDSFILLRSPEGEICVTGAQLLGRANLCAGPLLNNIMRGNRVVLCNNPESCRKVWVGAPANVETMLAIPLVVIEENTHAALGLINKFNKNFTAGDAKLLAALAQQVTTIINNHITHRKLVVEERISRELEIAAEIQESFLPVKLPQMGGLSMAVSSVPASEVGGDFYDFVTLDDRHLVVMIGDVSGKGIPAAMLTSVTRTMLRVEAMRGEAPHKIIQQANNVLHQELSRTDSFVTVFVASIDTFEGRVTYASAGHTPALLWRSQDRTVELFKATSLPVGIYNLQDNHSRTVNLDPGDTLVLYTDGITEAQSPNHDLFGLNRLKYIVESRGNESPEQLQNFIQTEVSNFRRHAAWGDDATMLILKTLAQAEVPAPQNISTVVKTVDFLYPANMDYLSEISQRIAGTCRELSGLPTGSRGDDFIYLIELAISEICTNIMKHAYIDSPDGNIKGQVTLLNNGVQLDFFDQGLGFDPNTVPEPDADPTHLREGGYGLHIVRQIMDVVSYESRADTGNHWHLIKFLPSQ